MLSLGASIPPELFEDILFYVGDEKRLWYDEDPMARREEMKHLSACALTCAYWAQLTRERMFDRLVLRSGKDLNDLRTLLRASSSDRLDPIGVLLSKVVIYYKLGDLLWFYNLPGLVASGANKLNWVGFHVLGPVPTAFTAGNTRRSVLHPLFFAVPRVMPMTSKFHKLYVQVFVDNIHFTHPTMLYNLLQDCKLLHPRDIICRNLTWDHDPTVTPSSFGWTLAHHSRLHHTYSAQCTDNAFTSIVTLSVPRHESSHRLHLNSTDSSSLLDIAHASWGQDASANFGFSAIPGFDDVQRHSAARLTPDCDLVFDWLHSLILFSCIASRRPGDDSNIRYVTYVIISPPSNSLTPSSERIKTVDWNAFLRSVQRFPDLRGIIIQSRYWRDEEEWRKCLVEFVLLLREVWAGVDAFLQLYHGTGDCDNPKWTQIPLSSVLQDIDRMKKEEAMHSPSNPEPTLEPESGPSNGHPDDHTVNIASASPSASSGLSPSNH